MIDASGSKMTKPALQKSTRGGLFAGSYEKFDFAVFGSFGHNTHRTRTAVGRSVNTIQAVIFGMMLSWTPSVVLLAILLWNDPRDPVDQP